MDREEVSQLTAAGVAVYWKERAERAEARLTVLAESTYEAIKHGDERHRTWLHEALHAHLSGQPVPPPPVIENEWEQVVCPTCFGQGGHYTVEHVRSGGEEWDAAEVAHTCGTCLGARVVFRQRSPVSRGEAE